MAAYPSERNCPNCGAVLSDEAAERCWDCGVRLSGTDGQRDKESEAGSRSQEDQNTVAGSTLGGAILGASIGGPGGALIGGFAGWLLGDRVVQSRREEASESTRPDGGSMNDGG